MIDKVDTRKANQAQPQAQPPKSAAPRRRKSDRKAPEQAQGMVVRRYFTQAGADPFDQVEWELRTAAISSEAGHVVFEQKDVEVPKSWSQLATNVVVQKYFRGAINTPGRERSVKQLIRRVVDTISAWGVAQRYFAGDADAAAFRDELKHLLVTQKLAFNSPVWFNVGVEKHPQCSACFINSVEDTMESILTLAKTEGMLFKYGSGTGTNLSPLRSSKEQLNGGGAASGPVSFMKGFDAFAGVIKSGGKTRRAAKMVILNVDHPDVLDFVWCKAHEEKKAHALIDAGYDGAFTGEAYGSIFFQNSNNTVRVTDDFMEAVAHDRLWHTRTITSGGIVETHRARDIWRQIAEAAWQCGDPGLQFDTTINAWHTSPASGRINASNPCSEYMFVDDSACNLASLNLRKFQGPQGELDVEAMKRAVEISILAQEIIVDNAKYPTDRIGENSIKFRPLGLGYANLGALLMSRGLPYDGEAGRAYAAAITALMSGHAYATSARIARDVTGPCEGFAVNREPFLGVLEKHRSHVDRIDSALVPYDLLTAARESWDESIRVGREHGVRNAQVTVLAPTGTIGFMMDCDTTGVEPDIALVKYKRLVGGGMLKIVNNTVGEALQRLGYAASDVQAILDYIDKHETIEGAPVLKAEHLPVFDCAFRPKEGTRSIHYLGHIRMMAAVQPFISGAISKTVNLPAEASVQDIQDAYLEAWRLDLKAIAVYRDGCKRSQPLSTARKEDTSGRAQAQTVSPEELLRQVAATVKPTGAPVAMRRRLPDERQSLTHKFSVAGHDGYITVGMYEDGSPGELFIRMAKEGSTVAGLMDCFATAVSLAMQHGVPLRLFVEKFAHTRFDPAGFTSNQDIPRASSIMDYIFRWLQLKFLPEHEATEPTQLPLQLPPEPVGTRRIAHSATPPEASGTNGTYGANGANGHSSTMVTPPTVKMSWASETDAPLCHECGAIMVRSGACHKCLNCGATSGCS